VRNFFSRANLKCIGIEIIGCLLVAIGTYNFAVVAAFPMAGFTGLSILLNHFTGFPIGVGIVLFNIPVAVICYRLLGRRFFLHSIFCMVLSSLMIDYLAPLLPMFEGSRMLAAIACGVVAGSGFALIFAQNASTGGTDFIIFAIKSKLPHLQLGKVIIMVDFIPVILGGLLFDDIEGMMYGMIIAFLCGVVIDRHVFGTNAGKLLLIVSDDSSLIRRTIEEVSGRGCTIWNARGGYEGADHEVIMCACDTAQMYRVQKAVAAVEPGAFTVILESSEVAGRGFRRLVVGERQE